MEPNSNPANAADTVMHWYDFVCPFCYVGQHRTAILLGAGVPVTELPFRAHPEIPPEGVFVGPRSGPMYDMLEREAEHAGLPLRWPDRLPNTRLALASAEWIREHSPDGFHAFQRAVFEAHFALGEDIGDASVLDRYASLAGVDVENLHTAQQDGSAEQALRRSEELAKAAGIRGTPAWLVDGRLISGLQPAERFAELARSLAADISSGKGISN